MYDFLARHRPAPVEESADWDLNDDGDLHSTFCEYPEGGRCSCP